MKAFSLLLIATFAAGALLVLIYANDMEDLRHDFQAYSSRPMLDEFPPLPQQGPAK